MAIATDEQVQVYVDQRVRPFAELMRKAYTLAKDHQASIDDVYAALTQQSPTWSDSRADGPPHLVVGNDVLAFNTFLVGFIAFIEGQLTDGNKNEAASQWSVMLDACVRPPEIS